MFECSDCHNAWTSKPGWVLEWLHTSAGWLCPNCQTASTLCTDHSFPEEVESSGRSILAPCFTCGLTAIDALTQLGQQRDLLRQALARMVEHPSDIAQDAPESEANAALQFAYEVLTKTKT